MGDDRGPANEQLRRSPRVTLQILRASMMLDMPPALQLAAIVAELAPGAIPKAGSPDAFDVASVNHRAGPGWRWTRNECLR